MNSRVSLVPPKRLRDEIESFATATGEDKSTLTRKLMLKGLEELKLDIATESYVKGKTSIERSSKITGVSIWRFLDELGDRKIGLRSELEDAKEEISRIAAWREHCCPSCIELRLGLAGASSQMAPRSEADLAPDNYTTSLCKDDLA